MQYLIRLVAPKGSVVMDCFMGSGSTGKATMFENRERNANYYFIGIEMTSEYLPICKARIDYAINQYEYDAKVEEAKTGQMSIFDF
jgi:DNA modification methylase